MCAKGWPSTSWVTFRRRMCDNNWKLCQMKLDEACPIGEAAVRTWARCWDSLEEEERVKDKVKEIGQRVKARMTKSCCIIDVTDRVRPDAHE